MDEVFTVIVTLDDAKWILQIEAKDETAAKQLGRKHVVDLIETKIGDRFAIVEFDDAFIDGSWRGFANV